MRRFRFGVTFGGVGIDAWAGFCRSAERSGYDVVLAPDHLGAPSPFAMLAAAAVATERIRLGTLVVNNEFHNPALLAREAATVDRLSGGRLELGLGAGHMKSEFEAAGIAWRSHAERVDRLEAAVETLGRLLAGGQEPSPHQAPRPPLLIGAHGERTLRVAARHADIVGFGGLNQVKGRPMGTFTLAGPEEALRRVEFVREHADGRDPEFNVLVQAVVITDDAEATADGLVAAHPEFGLRTGREVLDNPFVLVGSVEEVAAEIVRNRDAYGFSYVSTHGPFADALARVIPAVRRRAGEGDGVS